MWKSHISSNYWLTPTTKTVSTYNFVNELRLHSRNNTIQWKYNLNRDQEKSIFWMTEPTMNMITANRKTHLLNLFSVGMTIGSEPGVVPSLFPVRLVYSGEESPLYPLDSCVSWPECLFVPHFKHFTLSVGLIWPHVWQCHCSTDAMEPILIHTWLWNHNTAPFYENKFRSKKNENSWSTMLFVYNFFLKQTRTCV